MLPGVVQALIWLALAGAVALLLIRFGDMRDFGIRERIGLGVIGFLLLMAILSFAS